MKIICIMAQAVCGYPGQYAPEVLAAQAECADSDYPDYLNEQEEKARKSGAWQVVKRMVFTVDTKEFDRLFFGVPEIRATVEEERNQ